MKRKARKFSRQLGIDHNKLLGRKILFEFDPRTDYERFVRNFALECAFLGEAVTVITQKGSSVQQAFDGDQGIRFIDLERAPELLPILKKNFEGPISIVIDSLTDLVLNDNSAESPDGHMYKFVQSAFESLNETQNHRSLPVESFRSRSKGHSRSSRLVQQSTYV